MKRIANFLRLPIKAAFFAVLLLACADEPASVQFFTGSWSELLAEAKKQDKPIFVALHTVWCGPCRLMEKQAFPAPTVARVFNANFINYQLDMGQGEGPMLREKYAITAVPTLLFLSPDGTLIHCSRGYDNIDSLLAEAGKAIKAGEAPSQLSELEQDYEQGRRDTRFLRTYLIQRHKIGQPNAEALETYMARIPKADWSSSENIKLIAGNSLKSKSPTFNWLLAHGDRLTGDPSKTSTIWLIANAADRIGKSELERATTEADVERVIALRFRVGAMTIGQPLLADNKTFLANRIWMDFYERTKNQAGYRKLAVPLGNSLMRLSIDSLRAADTYSLYLANKRARRVPVTSTPPPSTSSQSGKEYVVSGPHSGFVATELNKLAKAYLAIMTDPADLQQLLAWSERTNELAPAWIFLDTHAQVLGKLGRKDEAVATELRVIELAKAAGEPTDGYEKVLRQLRQ